MLIKRRNGSWVKNAEFWTRFDNVGKKHENLDTSWKRG